MYRNLGWTLCILFLTYLNNNFTYELYLIVSYIDFKEQVIFVFHSFQKKFSSLASFFQVLLLRICLIQTHSLYVSHA